MKLYSVPFHVNLIEFLAELLLKEADFKKDLSEICVVFPSRRPKLFLNKLLSQKIGSSFISPQIFSIIEFIDYLVKKTSPFLKELSLQESSWVIFNILKKSDFLSFKDYKDTEFCEFFLWAKKIYEFLEDLDKDDISNEELKSIEKNAEIGYQVPERINILLKNLKKIREEFKEFLKENNFTTLGNNYQIALKNSQEVNLEEFRCIYFVGFFALRNAEKKIIKNILNRKEGVFLVQKEGSWEVFKELEDFFKSKFIEIPFERKEKPKIEIFECFDTHSQIKQVKEILNSLPPTEIENTCIMLPEASALLPLLLQAISYFDFDYNVSLGYPLKRTHLFSFLESLLKAQERKKNNLYYTKDYLKIITHPFIKNMNLPSVTSDKISLLIERIEKSILGEEKKSYSQKLFIDLREVEEDQSLFIEDERLKEFLRKIHFLFFDKFSEIKTPLEFAQHLEELFLFILKCTDTFLYIFSGEIFKKFFDLLREMKSSLFKNENFKDINSLFEFFRFNLLDQNIPFSGSPLKGLQILGALETRNLNFKNVIILDVNEGILPKTPEYESLIPELVKHQLGLPSYKKRDEIYRYHFKRLIGGAERIWLFYKNIPQEGVIRSRFIEEIIWREEKKSLKLGALPVKKISFNIEVLKKEMKIEKDSEVLKRIRNLKITPSALDTYLECPLKFYFRYIMNLEEYQDLEEDIEPKTIGNFFHEVLKSAYLQFLDREIILDENFEKSLFKIAEQKFKEYFKLETPESFLLKEILFYRLKRFLEKEKEKKEKAKILYIEREFPIKNDFIISSERGNFSLKGILDRVEERYKDEDKNAKVVILDYKTSSPKNFKFKLDKVNTKDIETIKENISSLQLPFYLLLVQKDFPQKDLDAGFYFLKTSQEKFFFKDYLKCKSLKEKREVLLFFEEIIKEILEKLLDPKIPFVRTTFKESCRYCPYSTLCKI